jgi:GNAT superfamily N-acetyltransferase
VVAIDPHKASWTAAAVDGSLQVLPTIRVPVNRTGYGELRRFAGRWPIAGWAIEGATGLGAPLTNRLRADGFAPVDVPAKLAARVRLLSTGHGRHTGHGIGRALVATVERWARSFGYTRITLETGALNQTARAFYHQLGYTEEEVVLTRPLN